MPNHAPNQNWKGKMWQDPLYGYFETHGKVEFKPGEQYDLSAKEQLAVLERNRIKQLLKFEFNKREFDPVNRKYHSGVIMDPAMFRWYAADMTRFETFRLTPKTVLGCFGGIMLFMLAFQKYNQVVRKKYDQECREGKYLWWDRDAPGEPGGHGYGTAPSGYG